ncbi:hypothetical protein OUZ56_009998 [Daphnia magna]|uniref:Uncharacterized protein n=1 Tax=Daphnia magna TaxID=35525 RepID=A0ABR0AHH8_9CRUS|nr:hypothetical protein OUZ56_009998 [Daphnia magna]
MDPTVVNVPVVPNQAVAPPGTTNVPSTAHTQTPAGPTGPPSGPVGPSGPASSVIGTTRLTNNMPAPGVPPSIAVGPTGPPTIVEEDFRQFFEARKDDPSTRAGSTASSSSSSVVHPLVGRKHGTAVHKPTNRVNPGQGTVPGRPNNRAPSPASSSHISRRTSPSQRAPPATPRASCSTSRERKEAEQALRQLKTTEDPVLDDEEQRKQNVKDWCRSQQFHNNEPTDDTTPDGWIDLYRDGRLPPPQRSSTGARAAIKADLGDFSGQALHWFNWIDLFKALVHDRDHAAAEKLAILKRHLRGDCSDIVYGLGGGETAYVEALSRLKETYGRKDAMRAALIQAVERLDISKQDPNPTS